MRPEFAIPRSTHTLLKKSRAPSASHRTIDTQTGPRCSRQCLGVLSIRRRRRSAAVSAPLVRVHSLEMCITSRDRKRILLRCSRAGYMQGGAGRRGSLRLLFLLTI